MFRDIFISNQWNCGIVLFWRMMLFSTSETTLPTLFSGWYYFQSMKSQNALYLGELVIFNQWHCRIRHILGLTLFSTNEIVGFVVFWVWRYFHRMTLQELSYLGDIVYFQPIRSQNSSYFWLGVIFNQRDCRIGRILGLTLFSTNESVEFAVFWGWPFFNQ